MARREEDERTTELEHLSLWIDAATLAIDLFGLLLMVAAAVMHGLVVMWVVVLILLLLVVVVVVVM